MRNASTFVAPPSTDPLDGTVPTDLSSPRFVLALRPNEAAEMLGISPRLLWSLTNQRLVPCVRFGRAVRYPLAELEIWLAAKARKGMRGA